MITEALDYTNAMRLLARIHYPQCAREAAARAIVKERAEHLEFLHTDAQKYEPSYKNEHVR